jgi:hypothetical protein
MPIFHQSFVPHRHRRRMLPAIGPWLLAFAVSAVMTWPLIAGLGHLGRTQNSGDGRFAVWNVAWVARTLITNPADLFDANIFFPHRQALAFSEANLGAGALAVPVWALTRNAFAAHNSVVLFAFTAAAVFSWWLAKRLTGDRIAAMTAAALFAFCPYVFAHTPHIQLLMVAGIPLCLLFFHELVDDATPKRAVALGVALAAQALSCAYYGIFVGLAIGYGALFYGASRGLWTSRRYWIAIGIAAAVSVGIVLPFFAPYLDVQQDMGFGRTLDEARTWSAYLRSYLASGSHLHAWLLPLIGDWNNAVLFPGFLAIVLGTIGAIVACRGTGSAADAEARPLRERETAWFYASLCVLTFWASLGPRAGLYTALYTVIPVFSFLRAPERMGILVMLCLAVFAAFAVREIRRRWPGRQGTALALVVCAAALIELNDIPFRWRPAFPIPTAYRVLARMPRGPVAEFPFYGRRIDFHLHTRYMLNSTVHWQPLVNGYSDHIPADFRADAPVLATFPSRESFNAMRERRVRYLTIDRGRRGYGAGAADVMHRLTPFLPHLRLLTDDGELAIYEVVSWPK